MDPNEKKYLASSHKGLLELCKKRGIPTTRVGKRGCISSKELIELLKEKDKEEKCQRIKEREKEKEKEQKEKEKEKEKEKKCKEKEKEKEKIIPEHGDESNERSEYNDEDIFERYEESKEYDSEDERRDEYESYMRYHDPNRNWSDDEYTPPPQNKSQREDSRENEKSHGRDIPQTKDSDQPGGVDEEDYPGKKHLDRPITIGHKGTKYLIEAIARQNTGGMGAMRFGGGEMENLSPPPKLEFQESGTPLPPVKLKSSQTKSYKKLNKFNLKLENFDINDPKFKSSGNGTSITLEKFIQELENEDFLDKFAVSIYRLLRHKYNFYTEKYNDTLKEYEKNKKKIKDMRRQGVDEITLKQLFPMKDLYVGFLIQLKDIINNIKERTGDIKTERIKENLLEAIRNEKKGFASIVGRENVKNSIVSQLYAFSQNYRTFTNSFNNICLLGGAGSGKTHLATVISYVFSKCGILVTDTTKIVSRADLVASYVGHTAQVTRGVLMETLEGVLFIDEAYQLGTPPGDIEKKDFGSEAITEIVNFLDKYIGMNVVIVAGYAKDMISKFFPTNEGLARRFPYRTYLRDYTLPELTDILIRFIESKLNENIDDETSNYLYSMVSEISSRNSNIFCNQAGDMLNLGTSIVVSINSSYTVKWKHSKLQNNIPIINEGFNEFLKMKGFILG